MRRYQICLNRRQFIGSVGIVAASAAIGSLPLIARAAEANPRKTRIGIIGSGNVGSALGRAWAKAGHPVMFFVASPRCRQGACRGSRYERQCRHAGAGGGVR